MWSFNDSFDLLRNGSFDLLGIRVEKGNFVFDLTQEEQRDVDRVFKQFEGYVVHPDHAEDIKNSAIAHALSTYAYCEETKGLMEEEQKQNDCLRKATAAIIKAYSIYQLPIYLYVFASYIELLGHEAAAKDMYNKFLKEQSKRKPKKTDEPLLKQFDVDKAIDTAKTKTNL